MHYCLTVLCAEHVRLVWFLVILVIRVLCFIVGVIRVSYLLVIRVSMYFSYLLVIRFQFFMTRNDYVVGVEKDEMIYFSFYLLD